MAFPEFCWYTVVSKPCTLRATYYHFGPLCNKTFHQIPHPPVLQGLLSFIIVAGFCSHSRHVRIYWWRGDFRAAGIRGWYTG